MKKAVKIIAIIYSVLAGLACIVYVIAMFKGNILESLLGILGMAVSLVLLWAIYVALDRIDSLEAFVLKVKMAQSKSDIAKISKEAQKPYRNCNYCGAIVRTDDILCPKCKHPYDD